MKTPETEDALIMWCTEGNEHQSNMAGLLLIQEILLGYKDVTPPKPIFYAPVNSRDVSDFYRYQPEGVTLITNGEGLQDAGWQLREIRRLIDSQRIKTLALIGHLPGCITKAAEALGQNGVTVTAHYNGGQVKTFQ